MSERIADAWLWSHENSLKVATVNENSPFYHGKGAFSKQPLYLIPADQVLVPMELLRQACSDDPTLRAAARNALKLRLHP